MIWTAGLHASSPLPPLAGARVLDLTADLAGGIATMSLGDYGADVVRLEATTLDQAEDPAAWVYANRGKRLVPAGPRSAGGLGHCRRLAAHADVVVVDGPAGRLEWYGLDAQTLRAGRPDLIHLWMPPHGTRGRGAVLPADDLLLAAHSGVADQQPSTEDRPVALVVPVLSYEQGILGALAASAALLRRLRSGAGGDLVVSGLHAVAALNSSIMMDLPGTIRPFGGTKLGQGSPPGYRAYECSDGSWLFLATLTQQMFFSMLEVMDAIDVMVAPGIDGDYAATRDPARNAALLDRLVSRMRDKPRAQWEAEFSAVGVPNAPCEQRASWLAGPTVAATGAMISAREEELGDVRMPNVPVELSRTPGAAGRPPGRHAVVDPGEVWPDPPSWSLKAHPAGERTAAPLDGMRVLDLGAFLAAPFVGVALGDLGATVVKVEQPDGDGYRESPATYAAVNRGKLHVALDLKDATQRAALMRLVAGADVLVDNLRPGIPHRLGIDYGRLRQQNSRIVRCTITGWGAGPLADTRCFDPLLQARSGLMTAQGGVGAPVVYAMPVHDVGAGSAAALGAVLALIERERSGCGQEVSTSLARISTTVQAIEATTFAGARPRQVGAENFGGPDELRHLYRCRDGWVAVSAAPAQRPDLRRALRPRSADLELPSDLELTVGEALDRLAAAGIPAARVLGRDDVMADGWLAANDFYIDVDDDEFGVIRTVCAFSECPDALAAVASWCHRIGGDSELVLGGGQAGGRDGGGGRVQ